MSHVNRLLTASSATFQSCQLKWLWMLLQTDKRNLGQKVMLQEIKDVAEKRKTEDDNVQLSAVSRGLRLAPDLTFNFRAV